MSTTHIHLYLAGFHFNSENNKLNFNTVQASRVYCRANTTKNCLYLKKNRCTGWNETIISVELEYTSNVLNAASNMLHYIVKYGLYAPEPHIGD